jgi:hypothetical protein
MSSNSRIGRKFNLWMAVLFLLAVNLTACQVPNLWPTPHSTAPALPPSSTTTDFPTSTSTPTFTPSPTVTSSSTSTPPPTITSTLPPLPAAYQSPFLFDSDTAHTYLSDICQYLRDKWDTDNAPPGTVVMVIMFHAIGGETGGDRISDAGFQTLMQALVANSFQAINTSQLADFMENNAWIPPRSVLLLVDDRRNKEYFDLFFRPYWEAYGWPVVNAWLNPDDYITLAALPGNILLENEGWVDHEAHGILHNIPLGPDSSDEYIYSELQGSIDAFQQNYSKTPLAIIWPGGGFSERPVEVARQLGFRLGFTINPRGPLMFNWVPLADTFTPLRPTWIPEGSVNDPLLVLPRYWDTDAIIHLDEVILTGQEAAAFAASNQTAELDYYNTACSLTHGPLP